jgi:DNA-binding MarR family transcriptional regulator
MIQAEEQYVSLTDLISLKDAHLPGGTLAMRPLNLNHVQQLASSNMDRWPAIIVTRLDSCAGYVVIDGYHRWEAARTQQAHLIKAVEREYRHTNAIIDAVFQANMTHGLVANFTTRGDYAFWLHRTFPTYPQEKIAERAGLTQGAVSKAIAKRERALQAEEQPEVYISPEVRHKRAKRATRRFTQHALSFMNEVVLLNDEALLQILTDTITPEERTQLGRLSRLLTL